MAITQNNVSTGHNEATTSLTISHTVASGADMLLVAVSTHSNVGTRLPTGATWNGGAMTQLSQVFYSASGVYEATSTFYYITNPTSGTHDVVISYTAALYGAAVVVDFTGVDTASPFGTPVTNKAIATSISVTYNGASDEMALATLCKKHTAEAPTSDSGQTNIGTVNSTSGTGSDNCYCLLDKEDAPAASNTSGWTWPTSGRYCTAIGVSMVAAAVVASPFKQQIIYID